MRNREFVSNGRVVLGRGREYSINEKSNSVIFFCPRFILSYRTPSKRLSQTRFSYSRLGLLYSCLNPCTNPQGNNVLLLFLKKTTVYKLQVEQPSKTLARKMTAAKNIEIQTDVLTMSWTSC